jgi:hypothetical protein
MAYLLVRHKVTDFAKWKPIFDAHESARVAAGLNARQILRGIDNPNEVVILFEASDVAKARTFVSSPGLKTVMQAAGVIDKPDLYFLQ